MNETDKAIVAELVGNFLSALNIVFLKVMLDSMEKGEFSDDFDKESFLDLVVDKWKTEVKKILQERVNKLFVFQNEVSEANSLLKILYKDIDVEDVQKKNNDLFKEACNQVDYIISTLKDHE